MRALVLCCAVLGVAIGCNSRTPIVEGIATLDGQPIDGGAILLTPITGSSGTTVGGTITAGKYRLAGPAAPAVGKYRIEVRWVRKTGKQVPDPTNPKGGNLVDQIDETIPDRYNTNSTLEIEVQPGVNRRDLALDSTN